MLQCFLEVHRLEEPGGYEVHRLEEPGCYEVQCQENIAWKLLPLPDMVVEVARNRRLQTLVTPLLGPEHKVDLNL